MIDQWFKNDLQDIYASHSVAVFIDESSDAEFLLKPLGVEYTIQQANTELEELHVKYLVEKAQPGHQRFLIYTRSKKVILSLFGNIARPTDAWKSVTCRITSRIMYTRP